MAYIHEDDSNGEAYRSRLVITTAQDEGTGYAELRERLGDEEVDRMLRKRELMQHPRPLDDSERAVAAAALAPVLADLAATGAAALQVRHESHDDPTDDGFSALVSEADGTGYGGVWIPLDASPAERVRRAADDLQEQEIEKRAAAGRSAVWPECPDHPDTHPLDPALDETDTPIWRCPRSARTITPIGQLALPYRPGPPTHGRPRPRQRGDAT